MKSEKVTDYEEWGYLMERETAEREEGATGYQEWVKKLEEGATGHNEWVEGDA